MEYLRLRGRKSKYELLRPKIKIKSMYWEFHKGDNDYNPSVPHGHSLDGKYKLELWSGEIYECVTGKLYATAKTKQMVALRNLSGFMEFVEACRKEYKEMHPGMNLSPLTANSVFTVCSRRKFGEIHRNKSRYIVRLECEQIYS